VSDGKYVYGADLCQKINRALSWWNINNSLLLVPVGQKDVIFYFAKIQIKYQTI